jgi:hypothetical protein
MNQLLKIIKKYNIELDIKFTKKTIICLLMNDDECHVIKFGFVNNLKEMIEEKAKEMYERHKIKHKELMKDLQMRANNKEIFPDDLFDN